MAFVRSVSSRGMCIACQSTHWRWGEHVQCEHCLKAPVHLIPATAKFTSLPDELVRHILAFCDRYSKCQWRCVARWTCLQMRDAAPVFDNIIDDAVWTAVEVLYDVTFAPIEQHCNWRFAHGVTTLFAFALVFASVYRAHNALSEGSVIPSVDEHKKLSFVVTVLFHFVVMCRGADVVNLVGHDSARDLPHPMLVSLWQRLMASARGTGLAYSIVSRKLLNCLLDVLRMAPNTQCGALLCNTADAYQIVPDTDFDFVITKPNAAQSCAVLQLEAQERVLHTLRQYARMLDEWDAKSIMRRLPVWKWADTGEWFGTWVLSGRSVIRASTVSALLNESLCFLMSANFLCTNVKRLCLTRAVCVAFVNGYAMQARSVLECAAAHRYKLSLQGIMLHKHEMGGRHVISEPVTPLLAALLAENDDCIRIARKPPLFLQPFFIPTLEVLQQYLRLGNISKTVFACASFANRVQHMVRELPPCANVFQNLYHSFLYAASRQIRSKKLQMCFAAAKGYFEGGGNMQMLSAIAMTTQPPDFARASLVLLGDFNTRLSRSWKKIAHILHELSRKRVSDGSTVQQPQAMLQSCNDGHFAADRHIFELCGVALPQYMCTTTCCKVTTDKTLHCSYDEFNTLPLNKVLTITRSADVPTWHYPTYAQLPAVWTAIVLFASMRISTVPE